MILLAIMSLLILLGPANVAEAADASELRSSVVDLDTANCTWTSRDFMGFYYDVDEDLGDEQLAFNLTDINCEKSRAMLRGAPDGSGKRGIVYTTQARLKKFKFEPWGRYYVIGLFGEMYFAGYPSFQNVSENRSLLCNRSEDGNLLAEERLSTVLIDSDSEIGMNHTLPLQLKEGYELAIRDLNSEGKKLCLVLKKEGQVVDTEVINYGAYPEATYCYSRDLEDARDIVIIAVHFDSIFLDADAVYATIDGIFQISDKTMSIEVDKEYNEMSIRAVDPVEMKVTMDNKDNWIALEKDDDTLLMPGIHIKTADQDLIDPGHPLRYYLYKKL